jgi:CBS domain-containing protein
MLATVAVRSVAELMTRDPVLAHIDMPLIEAAQLMEFYQVSGLPVIDWSGACVGVISQTDLLHARTTAALREDWPGLKVRHLMTEPAVTMRSTATIDEAGELMDRLRIHRVVVVNGDDEPIGLLSVTDLVRSLASADAS